MYYGHIEKGLLQGLIDNLNQLYPNDILRVQLFGSRARGDAGIDSDFDILIVVKDLRRIDRMKVYDYILDVNIEYGIELSLKIYDEDEFNKSKRLGIPFINNVLTEGRELWVR